VADHDWVIAPDSRQGRIWSGRDRCRPRDRRLRLAVRATSCRPSGMRAWIRALADCVIVTEPRSRPRR